MTRKLSRQQNRRINAQQARRLQDSADADAAIVVAHYGYEIIVSHNGRLSACDWRKHSGDIAVGDRVLLAHSDARPVIEAIYPRERTLYKWQGRKAKPIASHIDQLLICLAVEPDFQTALIDRYLIAACEAGIQAAILLNKTDLADAEHLAELQARLAPYRTLGYPLFFAAVEHQQGTTALSDWLSGKQTVLCGQSGVGKSSLIKHLVPDADIWIQTLSQATGLGRHTTTNLRRYPVDAHTALIDTPGVRGFALTHLTREQILSAYPDILAHAAHCRFNDCTHRFEPDCAVLAALAQTPALQARYDSLMQLLEETP